MPAARRGASDTRPQRGSVVNRLTDSLLRRHALDAVFDAYLDWRVQSRALQRAYREWSQACRGDSGAAFDAYGRALEREERAAGVYAELVRFMAGADPPGGPARVAPAERRFGVR